MEFKENRYCVKALLVEIVKSNYTQHSEQF